MENMSDLLTSVSKSWGHTQVKFNKFSYTWTISNFSFCPEENGEALKSPTFSAGENDKRKWCLELYPKGFKKEYPGYLSVYLKLVSCDKADVRAKFNISILNAMRKNAITHKFFHEVRRFKANSPNGDFGWGTFLDRDFLLNKTNGLLPDDKLTLFCEIFVIDEPNIISGQNKAVKFKIPECHLSEDLGTLFERQKFCDVTLNVNDVEFRVHKIILAARSPVFAAMFEHKMEETKHNRVEITDVDHEVLQEMLRFIYTEKVSNLEKMANKLLVAADKYALERLKNICEENIYSNLSVETAANALVLADMHSADQLKAHSIDFIISHATDVMCTTGWKSMVHQQPSLLDEVFGALATQCSGVSSNKLHQ